MIPAVLLNKTSIAVACAVGCFAAGWIVHGWKTDAEIKRQQDEYIDQAVAAAQANGEIIKHLQQQIASLQRKKDDRDARIPQVTDGRVCFANAAALQLWNEAILGEQNVSKNSSRTSEGANGAHATDADILRNINENGKRWQELRKQMESIIEWDATHFGPR